MLQYGLTWKSMLYTGNAIILAPPLQGGKCRSRNTARSRSEWATQWDPLFKTTTKHIPTTSQAQNNSISVKSRKGESTELWRRQQLPRSAELIVSKHSASLWRTDTISTWETTEHDELHAIWTKLLFKIIMYFLCGRPESYRKHRHRPYPIVPTAEDKTILSSNWLLAQQAAAPEMPPSWNQGYTVAEGQSYG